MSAQGESARGHAWRAQDANLIAMRTRLRKIDRLRQEAESRQVEEAHRRQIELRREFYARQRAA